MSKTQKHNVLLPAALSFSLIGSSHEPGAPGIIIYPLREVYASLNLIRKRLLITNEISAYPTLG